MTNKDILPAYTRILNNLKEKIRLARLRASQSVNQELLKVYWEIGHAILEQQVSAGWGAKIIDKLATDLKSEFPDFKGLSLRNLKYMRAFAESYPDFLNVQEPLAHLEEEKKKMIANTIVQAPLAQLSWYHHITLLDKIKSKEERLFYIKETVENGWSRNIMVLQIENQLYKRQGKALTNFNSTLSKPQSDLAMEMLKSPYVFDFISFSEEIKERELERALIQHLRKFMLELGRGFAYVGNQYNIVVEEDDYFLDLLFFNYHLNCFVLFELKVGNFKPEYSGKLNFYINTVNEKVKGREHNPTIGILLCKRPNDTVVKFALQGISTPMGVSDYELSKALPKNLKGEIPSIEELENIIEKEAAKLQRPIDRKLDQIKEMIKVINQEELKEKLSPANAANVFNKVLLPLKKNIINGLNNEIAEWFDGVEVIAYVGNQGNADDKKLKEYLKKENNYNSYKISVTLKGFKRAGTKAFNCWQEMGFYLYDYKYNITKGYNQEKIILENLYHVIPDKKTINEIVELFFEALLDDIQQQLNRIKE